MATQQTGQFSWQGASLLWLWTALAQGFVFRMLLEAPRDTPLSAALVSGVAAAVLAMGIGLQQAWPSARPARFLLWLGLLTAALAGCAAWVVADQGFGDAPDLGRDDRLLSLTLWGVGLVWCGVSLAAAAGESRQGNAAPLRLHWLRVTLHQNLAALAVTGVVYLVLLAGVALLDLVGVDIQDLVFSKEGTAVLLPLAWGLGVRGVRRQNVRQAKELPSLSQVAGVAGRLEAGLARALLPVMAVLVGIFLVGLAVQGVEPLWKTQAATSILLGMQSLVVIATMLAVPLRSAGETQAPAVPPLVRYSADALLLVLPILTALAVYALWLRIDQYGLTPSRVHAAALCGLAAVATLGLWLAALADVLRRDERWLGGAAPAPGTSFAFSASSIPSASLAAWGVALATVLVSVLLHTPLADPLGLTVRNQIALLETGRVDVARYRFQELLSGLGPEGREAAMAFKARLPELEAAGVYTAEQVAQLGIAYETALDSTQPARSQPDLTAEDIAVLPEGAAAPAAVLELAVAEVRGERYSRERPVMLTALQADTDPETEWLLIRPGSAWRTTLLDLQGQSWAVAGVYPLSLDARRLREAATNGTLHAEPPAYYELVVGDEREPLKQER